MPTVQPARPTAWRITKLAALNDGTGGTDGTRKVYFAADVILTRNYSALLFGTGDREKPLTGTTNDRFFLVKDTRVKKGEPASVTLITEAALTTIGADGRGTDEQGCAYSLASQWRESHQPADHVRRHHLFLDQSPVAAGGRKLLTQPIARLSAAACM